MIARKPRAALGGGEARPGADWPNLRLLSHTLAAGISPFAYSATLTLEVIAKWN